MLSNITTILRHTYATTIVLCLLSAKGLAQTQEFCFPTVVFEAPTWESFVPYGWEVVKMVEGDFNEDKKMDYAAIVQYPTALEFRNARNELVKGKPRLLFMVTQAVPRKFYRLVEQSNTFIPPLIDGEKDAFKDMHYERGLLKLDYTNPKSEQRGQHITTTYTFKFQLARFYLFGVHQQEEYLKTKEYVDYDFHFPNAKVSIRKGNDEYGDLWVQMKALPRMMMKHFGNFPEPYSWQVLNGVKI